MTLDQLLTRDRRIEALEALGRQRTPAERAELHRLVEARDHFWRRIDGAAARARRKLAEIEAYARQHGLPLGEACRG